MALAPRAYVSACSGRAPPRSCRRPRRRRSRRPARPVDALLLAGGADVDPASYGAEPHPETRGTWPERDAFEIALPLRALERDLPLLGICRGMQILNVALGGSLDQHLPESLGHQAHRTIAGTFSEHDVRLAPGLACAARGRRPGRLKSHHHQGVDRLGEGLRDGRAGRTRLVEAVELPGKRFALGVIWHPEEDADETDRGAGRGGRATEGSR